MNAASVRPGTALAVACAVTALCALAAAAPARAAGSVTGKYLGNGKEAKLAYVVVVPHEDWEGEKAWTIVATAKDPKGSKKPDFDAQFGELGDALVVSVTASGSIFSVQVCHQSLDKAGFSTSGTLDVENFKVGDGKIGGHFTSKGEHEFFGDKWSVDLQISGDLPKK